MISGWLGDRSGWTGVRFAELDRSSFVDRTVVRGSERWFVGRSSGSWIGVDRSDVLSGLWIVRGSERCAWIEALWFVDRSGSELWILGRSGSEL